MIYSDYQTVRIIVEHNGLIHSTIVSKNQFLEFYMKKNFEFEHDGPIERCERSWIQKPDLYCKKIDLNSFYRSNLNSFYRSDESLWRYIRYGDDMTFYIDPFSMDSLYSKPTPGIEKRIDELMKGNIPCKALEERIDFINGVIKKDNGDYTGDGFIFFLDWFRYDDFLWVSPMQNDIKYWNYLYHFRDKLGQSWVHYMKYVEGIQFYLMRSHYKVWSKNASQIASSLNDSLLSKRIDNSTYDLALICLSSTLNVPKNDLDVVFKNISKKFPDNRYSYEDFPFYALHWFSFNMLKMLYNKENSFYKALDLVFQIINIHPKYRPLNRNMQLWDSINALQNRHDWLSNNKRNRFSNKLNRKVVWNNDLKNILKESSVVKGKWWIPATSTELFIRGVEHHHCVDAYNNLHFAWNPNGRTKELIIFSESSTAHLKIIFTKRVVSRVVVIQNKLSYNRLSYDYTPENFADKLKDKPIELFRPDEEE